MKKSLALALAGLFLFVSVAQAQTWPTVDGTLTIVGSTATSIDLLVTQTVGSRLKLTVYHACFVGGELGTFVGAETKTGYDGSVLTFNTGPRRYKGNDYAPDSCWAQLRYQGGGGAFLLLDGLYTFP